MEFKEITKDQIKEKVYFSKSNMGLKVYFIPKKGYRKKRAVLSTNFGSIDNQFIPLGEKDLFQLPEGVAHFLEHKLFEDPKENIFEVFSKRGADLNAFTSFNQTSYLFSSTDFFYENLESLIIFVQNPYFTDENVEKEKGIIEQEIRMYRDNPNWRAYFNLLEGLYLKHPVKIDIAGSLESIRSIDKEVLYKAYNSFYHPSNMLLVVVGDLDFKKIMSTLNRVEKPYDQTSNQIYRHFEEEPKKINKKIIEDRMQTSIANVLFGFKDYDIGYRGEKKIKKDIILNIILDMILGSSSDFYNRLYNKGLIDRSFSAYYTSKANYGHSIISGKTEEPEKLLEKLIGLINSPTEKLFHIEDFERIKRKEIGGFLMGLNSINFIANTFTDLYFDGFNLLDYLEILESIKFNELIENFERFFKEEKMAISILRPKEI